VAPTRARRRGKGWPNGLSAVAFRDVYNKIKAMQRQHDEGAEKIWVRLYGSKGPAKSTL
jgi:hypothetical protein